MTRAAFCFKFLFISFTTFILFCAPSKRNYINLKINRSHLHAFVTVVPCMRVWLCAHVLFAT